MTWKHNRDTEVMKRPISKDSSTPARSIVSAGLATLALALAAVPAPAMAQAPAATVDPVRQRDEFSRILESVKVLAASLRRLNLQRGGNRDALVADVEARIRRAEAAFPQQPAEARGALDEAYVMVKAGLRDLAASASPAAPSAPPAPTATAPPGQQPATRADFNRRMDSARALHTALQRIATEKQDAAAQSEALAVQQLLASAEATAGAGDLGRARTQLDEAYTRARGGIERLRGGDTLVRSLNFATKDEEYRYELDRNDTFQMLVRLLVPEQSAPDERMRTFLAKATQLRREAEAQAERREFEAAVKTLEDSTREYQKVIRNAGVMIPG